MEAEGPLVVMVLGELLGIVSPTWVKVVQRERESDQGRDKIRGTRTSGDVCTFKVVNVVV